MRRIFLALMVFLLFAVSAFAQFDFPSSPTMGQQVTGPGGQTFQWDGTKWIAVGGGGGGGGGFTAGGDLSGTSTSQTVIGIRSTSVPALAAGYLHFNGTAFVWDTPAGGGGISEAPTNGNAYLRVGSTASWTSGGTLSSSTGLTFSGGTSGNPVITTQHGAAINMANDSAQSWTIYPGVNQLIFSNATLGPAVTINYQSGLIGVGGVNAGGVGYQYLGVAIGGTCTAGQFVSALAGTGAITCGTPAGGGGGVTSITAGTGLTGGTITTTGTIALAANPAGGQLNYLPIDSPVYTTGMAIGTTVFAGWALGASSSQTGGYTFNIVNSNTTSTTASTGLSMSNGVGGSVSLFGEMGLAATSGGAARPAGSTFIQGNSSTAGISIVNSANQPTDFWSANTHDAQIYSGGINIITGNLFFGGVALQASNLSDYATGPWTPIVAFGGAAAGYTGTSLGRYTKIGKFVHTEFSITITNKGTSTGMVTISGLPVAVNSATNGMGANCIYSNMNISLGNLFPTANTNQTYLTMWGNQTAGQGSVQLSDANFTNTSAVQCNADYMTN